jgi:hypothetical protein
MSEVIESAIQLYRTALSLHDQNRTMAISRQKYWLHRTCLAYVLVSWPLAQAYLKAPSQRKYAKGIPIENPWGRKIQYITLRRGEIDIGGRVEPIVHAADLQNFLTKDMDYGVDNLKPIREIERVVKQLKTLPTDREIIPIWVQNRAEELYDPRVTARLY